MATKLATYPWRVTRGSMVSACSAPAAAEGRQGRPGADPRRRRTTTRCRNRLWRGLGDITTRSCARGWRLQLRAQAAQEDPRVPRGQVRKPSSDAAGSLFDTLSLSLFLLKGGSSGDLPGAALAPVVRPCITLIAYSPSPSAPHRKVRRGGCEAPTAIRSLAFRKAAPKYGPLLRELERSARSAAASPKARSR